MNQAQTHNIRVERMELDELNHATTARWRACEAAA